MHKDVVELAQALIAIRSVSNDGNIAIIDYIQAWLGEAGFDEIERLEYAYKGRAPRANLVARKGAGSGGLAFLTHSDTVPGGEDAWPAFTPVVTEGRLVGRGSVDMKGPLAAVMVAAAAVDAAHLQAPLYVVVSADEEIGLYGARHIVGQSQLLRSEGPHCGVITEPTRLIPAYGHKGYGYFRVAAHGVAAHTSSGAGASASFRLAPFLAEMAALNERFQHEPRFWNPAFDPPTNGFNMVISDDGQTNVTAARAECVLTLRAMPAANTDEIVALITAGAERHGLTVEMARVTPPVYTDPASRLVQAACAATGSDRPVTIPFGTEGFHYQALMALVILGPGDIDVAHTVGESIAVAELEKAVDVYGRMIAALCCSA